MFKQNANGVFNNGVFSCAMIPQMKNKRKEIEDMHPQMQRLYQAAKDLRNLEKPADIARLMNTSQANLTNWASRGISFDGLVIAANAIGCDPVWLRSGVGDMVRGADQDTVIDGFVQITKLYWRAEADTQERMLAAIKTLAQQSKLSEA